MQSQVALVTGGTGGIGRAVAGQLAARGVEIILVGRDATRGEATAAELRTMGSRASFLRCDLALMREARGLASAVTERWGQIDMLVHLAGVMLRRRTLTAEGLETVFAVQYLARFLLTTLLLDHIKPGGVVVDVSAGGTIPGKLAFDNLNGQRRYDGLSALLAESIANDMLILELADRVQHVRLYNYGPGFVRTELLRDMPAAFRAFSEIAKPVISVAPEQAAADIVTLVTENRPSGLYARSPVDLAARRMRPQTPRGQRADPVARRRLWEASEAMIAGALAQSG